MLEIFLPCVSPVLLLSELGGEMSLLALARLSSHAVGAKFLGVGRWEFLCILFCISMQLHVFVEAIAQGCGHTFVCLILFWRVSRNPRGAVTTSTAGQQKSSKTKTKKQADIALTDISHYLLLRD